MARSALTTQLWSNDGAGGVSSTPYTVPAGKLFIGRACSSNTFSSASFYVNGVFAGLVWGNGNSGAPRDLRPIAANAGDVISAVGPGGQSVAALSLNGLLYDA